MRKYLSLLFVLLCAAPAANAQLFGSKTDSTGLVWKIRIHADASMLPLSSSLRDSYQGEYLNAQGGWTWKSWDSTRTRLHKGKIPKDARFPKFFQYYQMQLGINLNLYKGLYLGFNYSPIFVTEFTQFENYYKQSALTLTGLGTSVGYHFRLPVAKQRLSVFPQFSIGGYTDPVLLYYEGLGREWFKEMKVSVGYRPFKYDEIRLWAAWNQYSYREKMQSEVYPDKTRIAQTDLTSFFIGLGYSLNIHIFEEIK